MSPQKIGVILLNWNNSEDTLNCVQLLKKLDYPAQNLCIYVVDNGSEPVAVEKLVQGSGYQLILAKTNHGFAAGNNIGIAEALRQDCDYILLLNNDTDFHEDLLSPLLATFAQDPTAGIVSPKIYYENPPRVFWYAGGKKQFLSIGRFVGKEEVDCGQYNEACQVDFALGCCMLIHKDVFEKIGLLDPVFFFYHEDIDFSFRARKAGFSIWYRPESVLIHKVSSSTKNDIPFRVFLSVRGRPVFFLKHTPVWLLPVVIVAELYRLLRFAFTGSSKGKVNLILAYLKGMFLGLKDAVKAIF